MSSEVMEEMRKNPALLQEYEDTFSNEEKVNHALNLSRSNFVVKHDYIEFEDLSITETIKKARKDTHLGLTKTVSEIGIVTPIHVMVTESYADYLEGDQEDEFNGYKFIVIDGFRRVFAGLKNELTGCQAVIWEFKDKELGSQLLTPLARMLNRVQRHSWAETWYLYRILEMQSSMTPGTLEYLLQLESGDAMKLKDIMLSEYDEVKEELLNNKKTISQCYNMLQKLRKEEDTLMIEDRKGISEVEEAEEIVDTNENKNTLSDEDVKEILEMADNFDGDLSEEDFDEMVGNNIPEDRQEVGERHPLDPALKAETMLRDGYACVCCGRGKHYPMKYSMSILQSHHKISVANSGRDVANNIATVCQVCHTMVHTLLKNNMRFGISKDTFDDLPEEDQKTLINIMKMARIDYEAAKRLGKTKEQISQDNKNSSKFKMPGTDLAENMKALEEYNKSRVIED